MYRKIISVLLAIAFLFTNTIYAAPSHTKAKLSCLRVPLVSDKGSKSLSDRITTAVLEINPVTSNAELQNMLSLYSYFEADYIKAIKFLFDMGQGHLFAQWDKPGTNDDLKKSFLGQIIEADNSYPGGLTQYRENAKYAIADAVFGVNPFKGLTPEVPEIVNIDTLNGMDEEYHKLEAYGLGISDKFSIAVVAGGRGDRLKYNGIKLGIPLDLATERRYIEHFLEAREAIEDVVNTEIPFAIMTSDDNHDSTKDLLQDLGYQVVSDNDGKAIMQKGKSKVTMVMQGLVPAVNNTNADFVLDPGNKYKLLTKPHGHGDVHMLLKRYGLVDEWVGLGKEYTLFIQDTNGQVFNSVLTGLAVTHQNKLDINFITVPREAGEAAGSITKLKGPDGTSMVYNVEYNQIAPLLKETTGKGDVADPETRKSPYPGNTNVYFVRNTVYQETLDRTKGIMPEFVNPKFTDDTKTVFEPVRLETMMQDLAKVVTPNAKVSATNYLDKREVFSPVKNDSVGAEKQLEKGNYPDHIATGAADYYKRNRKLLAQAGMKVNIEGKEQKAHGSIPYSDGARVSFYRNFSTTANDVISKIKGGSIADSSTLIIDGKEVYLEDVVINGALIIKVKPGVKLEIKDLEVQNNGWELVHLTPQEIQDPETPEYLKMRGYKLVKKDQKIIDIEEPGEYEIGSSGVLRQVNNTLASNEEVIPRKLVANIVSGKKTASEILNEINDDNISNEELRNAKSDLYGIIGLADARNFNELQASLISFSKRFNYLASLDGSQQEIYNKMMIARSILARDAVNAYLDDENADALDTLVRKAKDIMAEFIEDKIKTGAIKESEKSKIKEANKYIDEWLSEKNMPRYIKQGIVRGMLEGRSDDLIFAFGNGWRQFGTAGIRNQAVNSSFAPVLLLELEEFAQDSHAQILGGPNLMNAITLLQQTATVKHIISSLRSYIEANPNANEVSLKDLMQYSQLFKRTQAAGQISIENIPDVVIALPEEFKRNLRNNNVTFSYDSRLNGKYLAQMLAADLLDAGIKVNLFENVSGMPSLTRASKVYGSIFGFLISASHSEPNYNGFKFVVGHLMSQVDSNFQKMIMAFRDMIEYDDIVLSMALSDPADSLKRSNKNLTWLGKKEPLRGHESYGAARKDFYTANYEHLKKRSPLAILEERYPGLANEFRQARLEFKALYTAFSGAGADNAESIREFLNDMGYVSINTVKSQTDKIDGRFPAFINGWKTGMPDPGDVRACAVNVADYILQVAGEDLSRLDEAIDSINGMDIAPGATDPDSDRMGAALKLDENTYKGATGNMRDLIISEVEKTMTERGYLQPKITQVKTDLGSKLNDKLHLTANDAWSFLTHFKFKILEDQEMLEKDKLYVIIKSHVTTSGLEGVAEYWRNKGYNVHVVDTWVGFTLLAERADLLFDFAKVAWEAISRRKDSMGNSAKLKELMPQLEKAYGPIAGQINVIDNAMHAARLALNEGASSEQLQDALRKLYVAANIDIVCGVEESNGYGEFGRIQLADGKPAELVNEHIKEKDGALALYEFMEIMVYLKVMNKSFHSAYLEMMRDAGNITATTNSYHRYVGAEGEGQKVGTIQAIEKELAFYTMWALDHKEAISFFGGRYKFDREKEPVEIFWDDKYDNSYRRFPEEGVRFNLVTEYKGVAYKLTVTYRPSGTGMENRDYNWAIGVIPHEATLDQVEAIRRDVEIVREQLVKDFFGEEGVTKGYLDKDKFNGILLAMNEGGFNRFREVFAKALGLDSVLDGSKVNLTFTEREEKLLQRTSSFAFTSRRLKGKITPQAREAYAEQFKMASKANFKLWQEYLSSDEAKSYPNKVTVVVKGKPIAKIPRAMAISWGVSVADYLTTLIENEFGLERSMDIVCDIPDLTKLIKQFIDSEDNINMLKQAARAAFNYSIDQKAVRAIGSGM
ncbi:MAG: UTP--glucose-1-phosphate uridylyltransferase [Candidatus Omnitrophica bacterium]|nr:UTP--glucose-1-phosphate uridylyltransferase [Candidatus Omnitrophota bacterium]